MNTQSPSCTSLSQFLPGSSTVTSLDKTIHTYRTNSTERRGGGATCMPFLIRYYALNLDLFSSFSFNPSISHSLAVSDAPPLQPCQDAKDSNQALSWMAISRDKGHGEEQDWRGGGKRGGTKTAPGTQGSNQPLT